MTDKPKGPKFVLTWKMMLVALVVYVAVRIALIFLDNFFKLGISDLMMAVIGGIISVLLVFSFARKKSNLNDGEA